jgi:hypothetical protein
LRRGYATASTNTGHEVSPGTNAAKFAFDKPEQLIDLQSSACVSRRPSASCSPNVPNTLPETYGSRSDHSARRAVAGSMRVALRAGR